MSASDKYQLLAAVYAVGAVSSNSTIAAIVLGIMALLSVWAQTKAERKEKGE